MNSSAPLPLGIILFAHGSRDPLWRAPIEAVALEISARQPQTLVRCAYLELCEPSLPDTATYLIAQGVRRIRVFPVFVGIGKHARDDLPRLIGQIGAMHPGVTIELLPTAGEHERIRMLMAEIALS